MAGIYIHIPFCKTKCIYCDFYSTTLVSLKEQYIQALCKELEMRKDYLEGEPIRTIYWGGGTPSLFQPNDFRQVFDTINHIYNIEDCDEITIEANPDDLTPEYLASLSTLPFNRISIGIQTFNNNTLKLLKRRHSAEQAIQAVQNVRLAGFNNISIDLIYGLPGETSESWANDLAQAIALGVEHISAYHLIYEEGTPLHNMLQKKQVEETSEDNSLSFFSELTHKLSSAGYEHYEISNFCLPGKYSHHNSSYWQGVKYLGCGPSAHSFNGTSREWNVASINQYIEGIKNGERNFEIEVLDKATRYNELIITSIRTMWGLSLIQLEEGFGTEFVDYALRNAEKHIKNGDAIIEKDHLRLTPKGVFISDGIMSDLLWVD